MINVLIVEDDPMVAEIHRNFISAIDGFRVIGSVGDGLEAIGFIRDNKVHLVILDIFMPGMDGVETMREIRGSGRSIDVIVVSAAKNMSVINKVLQAGAFDYIVKPFVFERIKSSLQSFLQVTRTISDGPEEIGQHEIDRLFNSRKRKTMNSSLPKGLNPVMLEKVENLLRKTESASSEEMAALLNVSRITARRYLEFMVASGRAAMERVYQDIGRPVNKYSAIS